MWQVWCTGMQGIYAQFEEEGQSAIGIGALFYIYIDLPLDCQVWCSGIQGIYA